MSIAKRPAPKKPRQKAITPLIGSLLRLPREVIVARMFEELNAHGFDITPTELELFMYPGPDGRRPADLARQCNMTRQAINYVLSGLERRGYIERHAGTSGTARLVRLTERGWEVVAQMRRCVIAIEQQWTKYLGVRRFRVLSETLQELSQWLGRLPQ